MAAKSEETKQEIEVIEVTLIKNIKYGDSPHKIGEKIEINKDDLKEFQDAKAIKLIAE